MLRSTLLVLLLPIFVNTSYKSHAQGSDIHEERALAIATMLDSADQVNTNIESPVLMEIQIVLHELRLKYQNQQEFEEHTKAFIQFIANMEEQNKGLDIIGVALAGERTPEIDVYFADDVRYFNIKPYNVSSEEYVTLCSETWFSDPLVDDKNFVPIRCQKWYRMQKELEAIKSKKVFTQPSTTTDFGTDPCDECENSDDADLCYEYCWK